MSKNSQVSSTGIHRTRARLLAGRRLFHFERAGKNHVLLLSLYYLLLTVLLFQPWTGRGMDEVFYYTYLSSPLFDLDASTTNDFVAANNEFGALEPIFFQPHTLTANGDFRNLWAVGSAVFYLPFYLPVRLAGWIDYRLHGALSWGCDRYSLPYLYALSFARLFYGYLGLVCTYFLCRLLFRRGAALPAAAATLGCSPLLYYVFTSNLMAHTVSYFTTTLLVYLALKHRKFQSPRQYLELALMLGLTMLVRWQNLLFILLPLLLWLRAVVLRRDRPRPAGAAVGSWYATRWGGAIAGLVCGAPVFVTVFGLQCIFWKIQIGSYFTIPQGGGFFHWRQLAFFEVLFSGWNGLFYYSPFLLVGFAGLLLPFRNRNWLLPYCGLAIVLATMLLNAAAGDWWGGSAFGGRRFCSVLPFFALGFGRIFQLFKGRLIGVPALITFLALCLNYFLLICNRRNLFAYYAYEEIGGLDEYFYPVLWTLLRTAYYESFFLSGPLVVGNYGHAALTLLLLGLGVTAVAWIWRKKVLQRLNRQYVPLAVLLLLLTLDGLSLFFLSGKAPRREFAEFMRRTPNLSAAEQLREIDGMIAAGTNDPAVYAYAVEKLGQTQRLREYAERLQPLYPQFCRSWLTNQHRNPALYAELMAGDNVRRRTESPNVFNFLVANVFAARDSGDRRQRQLQLKKYLDFIPMHFGFLGEYIDELSAAGESARADFYRRLRWKWCRSLFRVQERHAGLVPNYPHSSFESACLNLAQLYRESSSRPEELLTLKYYARYKPDNPAVNWRMLNLEQKLYPAAGGEYIGKLLEAADLQPAQYVDAHASCMERGNQETALRVLLRGFEFHPLSNELHYHLNLFLLQAPPAPELFAELERSALESPYYWLAAGEWFHRHGNNPSALRALEKSLAQLPEHPWANYICGRILLQQGRVDDAAPHFERAYRSELSDAAQAWIYLQRLCAALEQTDRTPAALQLLAEFRAEQSGRPELQRQAAELHDQLQKK